MAAAAAILHSLDEAMSLIRQRHERLERERLEREGALEHAQPTPVDNAEASQALQGLPEPTGPPRAEGLRRSQR